MKRYQKIDDRIGKLSHLQQCYALHVINQDADFIKSKSIYKHIESALDKAEKAGPNLDARHATPVTS